MEEPYFMCLQNDEKKKFPKIISKIIKVPNNKGVKNNFKKKI